MTHLRSVPAGRRSRRKNEAVYQKTIGINDWYAAGPVPVPLGNIQGLGSCVDRKPSSVSLMPFALPRRGHEIQYRLACPKRGSTRAGHRVTLDSQGTRLPRPPRDQYTDSSRTRQADSQAAPQRRIPDRVDQKPWRGGRRRTSAGLPNGRRPAQRGRRSGAARHDVDNLWIADSSTFATSAALNPAVTIAALSLRLGRSGALIT